MHLRGGVVIETVGAHDGRGEGEEVRDAGELLHLHGVPGGGGVPGVRWWVRGEGTRGVTRVGTRGGTRGGTWGCEGLHGGLCGAVGRGGQVGDARPMRHRHQRQAHERRAPHGGLGGDGTRDRAAVVRGGGRGRGNELLLGARAAEACTA